MAHRMNARTVAPVDKRISAVERNAVRKEEVRSRKREQGTMSNHTPSKGENAKFIMCTHGTCAQNEHTTSEHRSSLCSRTQWAFKYGIFAFLSVS